MGNKITLREMKEGDEKAVSELLVRTFNEFIAPDYSSEGVQYFLESATPAALRHSAQKGRLFLVAETKGKVVGVTKLTVRDHGDHISLLFVDSKHHRMGIARKLLRKALEIRRECNPSMDKITVNSSPYAVFIYEKLGFQRLGPEQVNNGMRFTPMVLMVSQLLDRKGR